MSSLDGALGYPSEAYNFQPFVEDEATSPSTTQEINPPYVDSFPSYMQP